MVRARARGLDLGERTAGLDVEVHERSVASLEEPGRPTQGSTSRSEEDSWTAGSVWLGDELGWRGLWVTCFENLDGLEAALRRGRPAGLLWR